MKWFDKIKINGVKINDQRWLIPIFIYLIVTVVVSVSGYIYYKETKKITIDRTSSQLQTLNQIKIDEIIQWLSERNKDVIFYQKNGSFSEDIKFFLKGEPNGILKLRQWLIQTQQSHDYDIFLVEKNLNQIFILGNDSLPLAQFVVDSCISAMRMKKNISLDIYRRPNSEVLFYASIAPITYKDANKPEACLIFRTRANNFFKEDILFDRMYTMNAVYSMIRNEGDSIYIIDNRHLNGITVLPNVKDVNLKVPPFIKAAEGIEGVFQGMGIEGKEVLVSVKKIPRSNWILAVHIDMEQVKKPLSQGRWMMIGYIVLLISIFIMWHLRFVQKEKNKNLQEQLRLNDELINNREILQTIIQSSPLPLIVLSKNNQIIIWNKAATKVFGWEYIELINKANPIFKDSTDEDFIKINQQLLDDSNTYFFETQKTRKDGAVIDLSCWVSNVVDPIKKENNFLLIFEDITERKVIENEIINLNESLEQRVSQRTLEVANLNKSLQERANQLETLNAELESFSYSVSHDLKAPLRSIQGFTDIILQEHSEELNIEVARLFSIVKKNARRMDQLIKDLLDLTRVARAELKFKKINMNEVIREVISSDFNNLDKGKVQFKIAPLLNSYGDQVLIRQVWQNLISNAIKYSQKKEVSFIDINSSVKDNSVVFSIKDNGVGFNPEYSSKLFNIFQRLHNSEEFEGTGVGLAIIKRIISRHHGEVWAESEEGKGATFYFTLPLLPI